MVERLCSQGLYFIISVILARLILPEIYGVVTVVSAIVNLLAVVVQSGFSSALIYSDGDDIRHYSTAFWGTVLVTGGLYVLIFLAAPLIAVYYESQEITLYLRVMSLQLVLQGIQSIPFAYVSKHMLFRKNYVATVIGVVVSAVVAIGLAFCGLGVWSLICLTSVEVAVSTVILWITLKFRIEFVFDRKIAGAMVRYCWKLVGVDFLNALYTSLNSMIIGKRFTKAQVAYYNKAYNLPQMLLGSVNTAVSKVLFPVFTESKGDILEVRDMLRKSIRTMNYVILPMLTGLAVVSSGVIEILYTDKWMGVVPYLQIMCAVWMFQPLQTCVVQAFKALGKSDIYLKLEFLKKICGLVVLVGLILWMQDAIALAWALLLGQVISCLINMPVLKKHLNYGYGRQLTDALASVLLCVLMAVATAAVGLVTDHLILKTVLQVFTGVAAYVLLSLVTKNENFLYIFQQLVALLPAGKLGKAKDQ